MSKGLGGIRQNMIAAYKPVDRALRLASPMIESTEETKKNADTAVLLMDFINNNGLEVVL